MPDDVRQHPVAEPPVRFVESAVALRTHDAVDAQAPTLLERPNGQLERFVELVAARAGVEQSQPRQLVAGLGYCRAAIAATEHLHRRMVAAQRAVQTTRPG